MIPASNKTLFGLTQSHLVETSGGFLLHNSVKSHFEQMQDAALKAGINLTIASSFRNFERQCLIWNNKFAGNRPVFDLEGNQVDMQAMEDWQKVEAILLYSALPGTSRHHWGTDIDVYDQATIDDNYQLKLEPQEYQLGGPFSHLANWLNQNAAQHGFYQPYLSFKGGVAQELWHLSHRDISNQLAQQFKQNAEQLIPLLKQHKVLGANVIEQNFDYILERFVYNLTA